MYRRARHLDRSQPAPGRLCLIVIVPGDVLFMPPGVIFIHAPISLTSCLRLHSRRPVYSSYWAHLEEGDRSLTSNVIAALSQVCKQQKYVTFGALHNPVLRRAREPNAVATAAVWQIKRRGLASRK